MENSAIKKGDMEWDRLFEAWKEDNRDAGWLVIGTKQYRVIAKDDDSIIFIPVTGDIDSMYGQTTQGVPRQ